MMLPAGWQGDAPGLQKWVQRWIQKGEAEEVRLAHFSVASGPGRNVREIGQVSCEEFGGDDLIQEIARIIGIAFGQLDQTRNEIVVQLRVFELDNEDNVAAIPDSREGLFSKPFSRVAMARQPQAAPPLQAPAFPGAVGASPFGAPNVPAAMPMTNLPATPAAVPAGARMTHGMSPEAAATAARVAGGQSATEVEQARLYAAMDPQMAMAFAILQNNQYLTAQVVAIARESIQAQTEVARHYSSAATAATSRLEQNLQAKIETTKKSGDELVAAERRIAEEKLRAEQLRVAEMEKQATEQRAFFESKLAELQTKIEGIKPAVAPPAPIAPTDGGASGMFQSMVAAVGPQILAQVTGMPPVAPVAPTAPAGGGAAVPAQPAAPAGQNAMAAMAQNLPPAQMAAMILGTDKARMKEILKAVAAMNSDAAIELGVSLAEAIDGDGAVGAPPPPPVPPSTGTPTL